MAIPPMISQKHSGNYHGSQISPCVAVKNMEGEQQHRADNSRSVHAFYSHQSRACATDLAMTINPADPRPKKTNVCTAAKKGRSVHFGLPGHGCRIRPAHGVLKCSLSGPQYNTSQPTPTFTLNVKFEDRQVTIVHEPIRFHANLLIDFEDNIRRNFPEGTRLRLSAALEKGYSLILFRRGLVKRVPVQIRGGYSVHPDASFTGFLNSVFEGGTVAVEWH
jgi:hypothetical protein